MTTDHKPTRFRRVRNLLAENQTLIARVRAQADEITALRAALGGLLATVEHERKTGLCQGSEWAKVVASTRAALAQGGAA